MTQTTVFGSQIARTWGLLSGIGLVITGSVTVVALFVGKNGAGITTFKDLSNGAREQSGYLLIHSGSLAINLRNNGDANIQGVMSGNKLYAGVMSGAGLVTCSNASTSKLLWNSSTNRFSCGTDQNTGGAGSNFGSGNVIAIGDQRYVNTSGDNMTGSLFVHATISGSLIHADTQLQSSGSLTVLGLPSCTNVQTSASGKFSCNSATYQTTALAEDNTWVGNGTAQATALPSCSNGTTNALEYNTSTNGFSCVSITSGTTYTAGQNLNLSGTSFKLNTTISGSTANFTTVSGSWVHAEKTLSSSGTLTWEGAASGSSLYVGTSINGAGLATCNGSDALQWTGGRFACFTPAGSTYTAGQGLTLTSGSFKLNATNTGSLSSYLTQSGAAIYAKTTLSSSGTLKVLGNMSGATLNVNSLKSCTNTQTDANGRLSCNSSVYLTTDLAYTAGQGLNLVGSTSFKLNATLTGTTLKGWTTISGALVTANTLASSGGLVFEGAATGSSLYLGTSLKGAGLADCVGAGNAVQWASATGRFSCASPTGTVYYAGQGLTNTSNVFKVNANLTGSTLKQFTTISGALVTGNTIASSGSLVWEGTASGTTLNVTKATSFMWIPNCAFLTTGAAGALACGTTLAQTAGGTNRADYAWKNLILTAGGMTVQPNGSGSEAITSSFSTNNIILQEQAFSGTGHARYAQTLVTMPQSYDGGTLTGSFLYTSTTNPSGSKNTFQWGIQCIFYGSGSTIDTAWGTAQTVNATVGAATANQMQKSGAISALTCAGTASKQILFRIFRDPTVANNLPGTGRLLQVPLRFKTNSYSD